MKKETANNTNFQIPLRFLYCIDKDSLEDQVKCIFAESGKLKEYNHSIRVDENLRKLSEKYNMDKEKSHIAALLHDTGKIIKIKDRIEFCRRNDIEILDAEQNSPGLLHQKISAKIANLLFEVEDNEILNAISMHTTLKADTVLLDRLLFLADKLSGEDKEYKEVLEKMNKEVYENSSVDRALAVYFEYLCATDEDKTLHPWTRQAYRKFNNSLL